MDGFRATLQDEFDSIYVFNLRGNQRTSGELSRKEGGKIFGSGSRIPIAVTLLVRTGKQPKEKARIYYRDIGDYLSREKKLEIVKDMRSMLDPKMKLVEITPNEKNDWINQRDGLFDSLIPMEPKKKYDREAQSVFLVNSRGLETARDAWLYSFSLDELKKNIGRMIEFYNSQLGKPKDDLDYDPTKISWSSNLISAAGKSEKISTLFT